MGRGDRAGSGGSNSAIFESRGTFLVYKYKRTGKESSAKKTAWKWFSKYIRLRDCLKTTGSPDYCKCITCGRVVPYEDIDAGHAIPGRTDGILFDESIVFGQCRLCNQGGDGEKQAFKRVLVEEHGEEWYDEKVRRRKTAMPLTDESCRLIANHYRLAFHALEKQ